MISTKEEMPPEWLKASMQTILVNIIWGFLKKKVKKLTSNFTSNRILVCVRPL